MTAAEIRAWVQQHRAAIIAFANLPVGIERKLKRTWILGTDHFKLAVASAANYQVLLGVLRDELDAPTIQRLVSALKIEDLHQRYTGKPA